MHFVNGVLMFSCKYCIFITSHPPAKFHHPATNNSSLKILATHPCIQECAYLLTCGNKCQKQMSETNPSKSFCFQVPGHEWDSFADAGTLASDLSQLETKLHDYKCNSMDPNASSITKAIHMLSLMWQGVVQLVAMLPFTLFECQSIVCSVLCLMSYLVCCSFWPLCFTLGFLCSNIMWDISIMVYQLQRRLQPYHLVSHHFMCVMTTASFPAANFIGAHTNSLCCCIWLGSRECAVRTLWHWG